MCHFKLYVRLLFFINTLYISCAEELEAPIVSLPQGKIQGHVLKSPIGLKNYYAYQDIPYASPPVGKLRFQEPIAPQNWTGILNATKNSHSCFLSGVTNELPVGVTEDEDCLYLNVYTPVKSGSNAALPVLFWIHGGGFIVGDGTFQSYGPQFLIDYDIVIVTINYRLGIFGFLSTEDNVISGNFGLKDQNFAMRWVQRNIALFGGDPKKVTIDGESAGGASVGLHVISKKSGGLFRAAILQSGTPLTSITIQKNARSSAFNFSTFLDEKFNSNNSTDLLLEATAINNIAMGNTGKSFSWSPVKESESYKGAFLTGLMHENVRIGNINQVPLLIGYNSEENIFMAADEPHNKISRGVKSGISTYLEKYISAVKEIRSQYPIINYVISNINSLQPLGMVLLYPVWIIGVPPWRDLSITHFSSKGLSFYDKKIEGSIRQTAEELDNDLAKVVMRYNMTGRERFVAATRLRGLYTNGTFQDNLSAVVRYSTDADFTTPTVRHAELQSNFTTIYLYQFSYKGMMGCSNFTLPGADTVGHAEDLKYFWHIDRLDDGSQFSVGDRLTQLRLLKLWSNFVKNPTPEPDPLLQNIEWTKVTSDNLSYLNINRTLEVRKNPKQYQQVKKIIDSFAIPPLDTY